MILLHLAKNSPLGHGGIERVVYEWMLAVPGSLCVTNRLQVFKSSQGAVKKVSILTLIRALGRIDKVLLHWPNLAVFVYPFFFAFDRYVFYHADIVDKPSWLARPLLSVFKYFTSSSGFICHSREYFQSSLQTTGDCFTVVNPTSEFSNTHSQQDVKLYDFVFVGRNVRYKGLELFVESAQQRPDYRFAVISSGVSGLPPNCILFDNVGDDEKIGVLSASKYLVLPSVNRAEAFGIVLVESKELGLPVIVSDASQGVLFVAGTREQGGFVFENLSVESLTSVLDEVQSFGDEEYKRLSNCAAADFEDRFSRSVFLKQVHDFLNR